MPARPTPLASGRVVEQIAAEQVHCDRAYLILDHEGSDTTRRLRASDGDRTAMTPQSMSERDALSRHLRRRLVELRAVEHQLCFGRLDFDDGETFLVGRIGLTDEHHDVVLVDWRASAASPFYRATPGDTHRVSRRRHIQTVRRVVTAVHDDLVDLGRIETGQNDTLVGEAALLAAVDARRTGRMGSIVATIQAEQDRVIRAPMTGTLVVQGGPGTGKTAVALHRAAYLLYQHRSDLAASGVLVIGPNTRFLRYVENVIPELGETGVILATLGTLHRGIDAEAHDERSPAAIKGDLRMLDVLDRAIRAHQRVPAADITFRIGSTVIRLGRDDAVAARGAARRTRLRHNLARATFARVLIDRVAEQLAPSATSADEHAMAMTTIGGSSTVRTVIDALWPTLSPERLVAAISTDVAVHRHATGTHLTDDEAQLLWRGDGEHDGERVWSVEDVALLDEARVLLGEEPVRARPPSAADVAALRRRRIEAQIVLDETETAWITDADTLLARYDDLPEDRGVVERAKTDRDWTFGHVIIDEAQELSPMQWRMVMRRCPTQSMTIVGDIAQASSPAASRTWDEALRPHLERPFTVTELTVNYRSPAEMSPLASSALDAGGIGSTHPTSVRSTGIEPVLIVVEPHLLSAAIADAVERELADEDLGTVAVITARSRVLDDRWHDRRVTVIDVEEAKGLEFDAVVVVDPAQIIADSPRGHGDLYVALTRTTHTMTIVAPGTMPDLLVLGPG